MSDSKRKITPADEELLKQYDLLSIHRIFVSEHITEDNQKIADLFNRYYLGLPAEDEGK